jgi:hypothetical protein
MGVFTDIGVALGPINSPLPIELWKELEELILQWDPYYMMPIAELQKSQSEWMPFENKGIELAKKIGQITGIPITYHSPGFRRDIKIP